MEKYKKLGKFSITSIFKICYKLDFLIGILFVNPVKNTGELIV